MGDRVNDLGENGTVVAVRGKYVAVTFDQTGTFMFNELYDLQYLNKGEVNEDSK